MERFGNMRKMCLIFDEIFKILNIVYTQKGLKTNILSLVEISERYR